MKEIIEQCGTAIIATSVAVILISVTASFFRDGGVIYSLVTGYLSSVCG